MPVNTEQYKTTATATLYPTKRMEATQNKEYKEEFTNNNKMCQIWFGARARSYRPHQNSPFDSDQNITFPTNPTRVALLTEVFTRKYPNLYRPKDITPSNRHLHWQIKLQ
jgi:hypothetical protein